MTFKEKLQMEHPEYVNEMFSGGCRNCPGTYGYEEKRSCEVWESDEKCAECWNREMPNTEPKEIKTKTDDVLTNDYAVAYEKGFEDGMSEGLTQGQNDAWELVDKLWDMNEPTRRELFGDIFVSDIIKYTTPQEALAKLKAYEEAQSKIEVGDVLETMGSRCVVTSIDVDEKEFVVLWESGCTNNVKYEESKKIGLKKTGKHIDIKSILEQIGE